MSTVGFDVVGPVEHYTVAKGKLSHLTVGPSPVYSVGVAQFTGKVSKNTDEMHAERRCGKYYYKWGVRE